MKKLITIVNDEYTLGKLGKTEKDLSILLHETGTDGFELLKTDDIRKGVFPKGTIIGRHLFFYPMWMDFILGNVEGILEDFGDLKTAHKYYGAKNRKEFTDNLRKELKDAELSGAEYAVMHVSHMSIREAYTYSYKYETGEIIREFSKILNEATEGENFKIKILLENTWYPGLDMLKGHEAEKLLKLIRYPDTFLLLDTGHLVNTDRSITDTDGAVRYIEKIISSLGKTAGRIAGIHLNITFSGEYANRMIKKNNHDTSLSFNEKMTEAMGHIGIIDKHEVFNHNGIESIIKNLNPQYLIYELSYKDKKDLTEKINHQNRYLNL